MCPGMRPATGWIAYLTSTPRSSSSVRQLPYVVLRLRHRQPVAGDDDDLAGERELDGDVLRRRRADRATVVGARLAHTRLHLAERAEEDVRDRAVHRLAHQQREQRSRGADEHPATISTVCREHEAGGGGGEPGERVQERDHDGHVGAADRQDEHDAEQRARARISSDDHPLRLRPGDGRDPERDGRPRTATLTTFCAGKDDRPPADQLLQLRERDRASRRTRSSRSAPRARSRRPRPAEPPGSGASRGTPRARRAPPRRRRPR